MISRLIGAVSRAILVALLIAMPALMLPASRSDMTQVVALIALLGAVLTFVEYFARYPSIVEFRDAKPLNRLRFTTLSVIVLSLVLICRDGSDPTPLTGLFRSLGAIVGNAADFPYSPVRLVVLSMPTGTPPELIAAVRAAAGVAYAVSALSLVVFFCLMRLRDWPQRSGVFNVWVNLPLFDPTAGADVLYRLKRDANINVALGFLLPFLIPAILTTVVHSYDPITLSDPQTLVWTMTAWAFLPASMIMRGMALWRVAEMIEEKRRRANANAEALRAA